MRKVLFTAVLAALVAVPAAVAAPGDSAAPVDAVVQVEATHPVSLLQLPDAKKSGGVEIGVRPSHTGPKGGASADASCGTCIVDCWGATWRVGPSDLSGHAYIYQHDYWCGNGSWVTYAQSSQTYDQSGWFQIGSTYGPWWSGGCIGCSYISASGYMTWSETIPNVFTNTGTSWLTVAMYAYGSSSGSGASAA